MIEILKYKPINKNSLVATFDIKIAKWGDFIIQEMTLMQKENQKWIGFPQKIYEKDGQKKYFPYMKFATVEMAKKFQEKVLEALDASPLTKEQPVIEEAPLIQGDMPF